MTASRSPFKALRWPHIVAALIALLAFVPYVVDTFTEAREPEVYAMPMTGMLVGLAASALAIYCFAKRNSQSGQELLVIAGLVVILSFLPKITAVAITLLSLGVVVREVLRITSTRNA